MSPFLEVFLKDVESILKESFKDTIIWEEKGVNLVGRYAYVKFDKYTLGLFMGFGLDSEGSMKTGISFVFVHPTLSSEPEEELIEIRRLFYRVMIQFNLRLKERPYKLVSGRKLPALMRTLSIQTDKRDARNDAIRFFNDSINVIKHWQPMYKIVP